MDNVNSAVVVCPVATRAQARAFVSFPRTLYKTSAVWVPPMRGEERHSFTTKHNAILAGSDFQLFLACRDHSIVGRVLVFIHHAFNRYYQSAVGFFGCFECVEDLEVARALMETASTWLAGRGMKSIRGPIHQYSEMWGFLLEGFDDPPVFLSPYNPPYYNSFMEKLGFPKVKDLLAYEADASKGYVIPERFVRFLEMYKTRHPKFRLRRLERRNLMKEAEHICRLTNIAVADNWGYVPVDEQEMKDMVRALEILIDPDAIWFVEKDDQPVGYCLGFPDLNVVLKKTKGRLFPRGIFHLLFCRRRIKNYRLFGLAIMPEYHGLGLDVLLYCSLAQALTPKGIRLEVNYILEDNLRIRNPLEKLNLKLIKKYRVYEKPL